MNQDKTQLEKRRFTRVPFDAHVHMVFESKSGPLHVDGILVDISMKGLLVSVAVLTGLQIDTPGTAIVKISNADISFSLKAVIRHIEEDSIGLDVVQMPIESAEHLRQLMLLNLGDESLLQRELKSLAHAGPCSS